MGSTFGVKKVLFRFFTEQGFGKFRLCEVADVCLERCKCCCCLGVVETAVYDFIHRIAPCYLSVLSSIKLLVSGMALLDVFNLEFGSMHRQCLLLCR